MHHVQADGLTAELAFVQADLDAYKNVCVDAKTANAIADRATRSLIARGYVTTRVLIPQQDLTQGIFRVTVVPGRIHSIGFTGRSPATYKDAFPTGPGHLLNLRDLDEGLEQMKRVPADDVTMQIEPAQLPGESDIAITVKQTPQVQAAFDVNNSGTQLTGVYQGSATFAFDNLFHANDILNVSLNGPAQGGVAAGNRGNNVSFSIPAGYWTFTVAASKFDYAQNVAGFESSFTLTGTQHHTEGDVERTLYRTTTAKTSVEGRIASDASRSFVDGTEIDVQHTDASYGELDLVHEGPIAGGRFNGSIGARAGLPMFGTLPDVTGVANPPTNFYTMAVADVSAGIPLKYDGVTFVWRPVVHAQATAHEIASVQQFSIGNRYSVRGFDGSSTLIAESGYYFRNDLELSIKHGNSIYAGLDTGAVWGPNTAFLSGHSLTGMAVGVRGSGRHVSFDASVGFALSAPPGFATAFPTLAVDTSFRT